MNRLVPALAGVLLIFSGCSTLPEHAGPERLYWNAPVLLPQVTADLRRPGFWIGRLAAPDEVVMDAPQIEVFHQDLRDRKLIKALPAEPNGLGPQLSGTWNWLSQRTYYLPDGTKAGPSWWAAQRPNLNLGAPDPAEVRYAVAVAWADQRVLPDRTRLTAEVLDYDFDEFQNSGYDLGTGFQVGRPSADGLWLWTQGTLSDGWVEARNLALCDRATFEAWQARPTVVITSARADLWSDSGRHLWRAWVRMGGRLPVEADEGDTWRVTLPTAGPDGTLVGVSAWVAKTDAVAGSLPYTRRTVVEQAFKLLDRPYGWGDSYGEQDCSRFLAQIFATVGVTLPRNSGAQGQAGVAAGTFARKDPAADKAQAVAAADPATTLLRLDGHIMLLLGAVDGTPYVIHCLWAYTQREGTREVVRVVNGVAVSTLSLSEGSQRGSLLERIRNVRIVGLTGTSPESGFDRSPFLSP